MRYVYTVSDMSIHLYTYLYIYISIYLYTELLSIYLYTELLDLLTSGRPLVIYVALPHLVYFFYFVRDRFFPVAILLQEKTVNDMSIQLYIYLYIYISTYRTLSLANFGKTISYIRHFTSSCVFLLPKSI